MKQVGRGGGTCFPWPPSLSLRPPSIFKGKSHTTSASVLTSSLIRLHLSRKDPYKITLGPPRRCWRDFLSQDP